MTKTLAEMMANFTPQEQAEIQEEADQDTKKSIFISNDKIRDHLNNNIFVSFFCF